TRWLLKDMSYSLFDNLEEVFALMVNAFKAIDSGAAVSAPSVDKANGSQERAARKRKMLRGK
ncbi:MAG: hypothetical protein NTY44_04700, partial [Deltaproteobacteria bacterium]|nr:hypothetical protein [Deltaproteobacteria bacterium]